MNRDIAKTKTVYNQSLEARGDCAIRQVLPDTYEYQQELELRDLILRKPLGLSVYSDDLESEKKDYHIGAFYQESLIGVLILTPLNNREIKMRQVAVNEAYRGNHIGSRLVIFAEELARDLGYRRMVLNARKTAVNFYQKQDYEIVSQEFIEVTIPHYKMAKNLTSNHQGVEHSQETR